MPDIDSDTAEKDDLVRPVAWCTPIATGYQLTSQRDVAERWAESGATVNPLYLEPPQLASMRDALEANQSWRCFHCDEVFTERAAAQDHFGYHPSCDPACKLNAMQGGLIKIVRKQEEELDRFRAEETASFREFYSLGADHSRALIHEEQKGYDRGLADARAALNVSPGSAGEAEPVSANGFGCVKPDNDRQVFFYEQDFYILSNFSAFNLRWKGQRFATSEQAYHWEKFVGVEPAVAWAVQNAYSAHDAFKVAETDKALRRKDWDDVKVDIMRDILRAKAEQHEYVRRKLLATGDRELIEDSWRDDFWGWGPNRTGKNMLGKLWMEVRAELRAALTSHTERE